MIRRKLSLLLAVLTAISTMTAGLMPVTAGSDNGITTDLSAPYMEDEYEEIRELKQKDQADPENTEPTQIHRESLYTKTTDNGDGTKTLEVYGEPVRYITKDGSVKDISLTPVRDGAGFRTGDHRLCISFPEKAEDGISLNTGEHVITATPVIENGTAVKTESALLSDTDAIVYRTDPKTSYEYNITYSGYKENIVVSEYTGQTDFLFRLETDGLLLSSSEGDPSRGAGLELKDTDGIIVARISDIIVFSSDNRNNTFGEISYETVAEGGEYILRVSLSAEYLSDPNTHYPIYIDPTITVAYDANNNSTWNDIEDITVNQNQAADPPYSGTLYVGKAGADYGAMRSVMRFPELELYGIIPGNITSATVNVRDLMCYGFTLQVDCYGYGGTLPSTAFTTSNMTWSAVYNTMQYYESNNVYRSTNYVSYNNGYNNSNQFWYEFNILPVVQSWAQGRNAGTLAKTDQAIVFKATDSYEQSTSTQYVCFGSYDRATNKPSLTITYEAVSLNQYSATVGIGKSIQLTVAVYPSNLSVIWYSSDDTIASVSQDGTVTGTGLGSATITVQCSGSSASCAVTVIPISEGVYRVFNWSSLSSMKVDRYGIANMTNVSCSYDLLYDYDNITEKNALWILTHLSNNTYTLRPVHKPNLALDYTSSNADVYGIGIDYSFSLDSTRWKITASSSGGGYIVQNNGLDSRTLALDSSTGNVYISNGYTGSPFERWGFIQLTDTEVNSLKGIIVYGNSAVKTGTSSQLTAGVFSPVSLNQSATYYSNSLVANVTANGSVTGVYEGDIPIGVTSSVDSSITGSVHISIVDRNRQTASLVGIPSNLEGTHDHHSYFSQISSDIQSIYGSTSSISTYTSVSNGSYCKGYICNSDVFVFRGHGTQNSIYFGDDEMYSPTMFISDVSLGGMRIFSDSELVVYCCCLCGEGGMTADNLVVATYNEGAKNVIGFKISINCSEANDWLGDFFDGLALKGQIDHSTICQVLSEIEVSFVGKSVSKSNLLYMYN